MSIKASMSVTRGLDLSRSSRNYLHLAAVFLGASWSTWTRVRENGYPYKVYPRILFDEERATRLFIEELRRRLSHKLSYHNTSIHGQCASTAELPPATLCHDLLRSWRAWKIRRPASFEMGFRSNTVRNCFFSYADIIRRCPPQTQASTIKRCGRLFALYNDDVTCGFVSEQIYRKLSLRMVLKLPSLVKARSIWPSRGPTATDTTFPDSKALIGDNYRMRRYKHARSGLERAPPRYGEWHLISSPRVPHGDRMRQRGQYEKSNYSMSRQMLLCTFQMGTTSYRSFSWFSKSSSHDQQGRVSTIITILDARDSSRISNFFSFKEDHDAIFATNCQCLEFNNSINVWVISKSLSDCCVAHPSVPTMYRVLCNR